MVNRLTCPNCKNPVNLVMRKRILECDMYLSIKIYACSACLKVWGYNRLVGFFEPKSGEFIERRLKSANGKKI